MTIGVSLAHNLIVGNLFGALWQLLRETACSVFVNEMAVRLGQVDEYAYPDVVAACHPLRLEHESGDALINPSIVIEVVSPASEAYDRGEKFRKYRQVDSLREYILVAQAYASVERYLRQGDTWVLSEVTGLDPVVAFDAIGCSVSMRDIYYRVNLDADTLASPFDAGAPPTD